MNPVRSSLLMLYDSEPPGTYLLAHLSSYAVELSPVPRADLDAVLPDLPRYEAILVYTPVSLPSGCSLCRRARPFTDAPILLLAPSSAPEDILLALQHGADTLLPTGAVSTLVAECLGALLRRWLGPADESSLPGYQDAMVDIDPVRRKVRVAGRLIHLTPTEFRFLALLVRHTGELLSYEQILNAVWGWKTSENRIVHTFAAQVRAKLGEQGARYISNEYGRGYRFAPPP